MKTDIHPNYVDATIVCSCGNTVQTRSTKEDIHVEICSNCHPFYTGKQKLMDTGGRLARFQAKVENAGAESKGKKKKANVRTFTPAADPKVLAAKQARAEAKALEDAKKRKEAEEAAKAEREAAKLAKEQAEAEAIVAAGNPEEAPAAEAEAPAAEAEAPAAEEAAADAAPAEEPAAEETPAEEPAEG